MSVETWKSIADWATIVFIALTVVSGSTALILGDRINEKQAEQLQRFNTDLTAAKTANLELEKALTLRRLIVRVDPSKNVSNIDPLKPFSGVKVILEFLPDIEASRAASDISGVLTSKDVGWNVVEYTANPELNKEFFDGVTVIEPLAAGANPDPVDVKTRAAAGEFIKLLKANDWDVKSLPAKASAETPNKDGYIAPNTIKISVGFKPSPFSLPRDVREAIDKMRQDFIRQQKEVEEQARKHIEEQNKLRQQARPK